VGALGHYIEDEGIATTGISLVREHTEGLRPPRFLWVPFEMGRPLGTPNHPDFQMKVLRKSLSLLESNSGPVLLETFDEEAPIGEEESNEESEGWTCPINLPLPPSDRSELETTLLAEMASLSPWYELSMRKRGGSSVGASPLSIEQIAKVFIQFLDGNRENPQPELSLGDALKLASEDLKAWYMEAATAQPGHSTSAQIQNWFWGETTAGAVFLDLCDVFATCDDPILQYMSSSALVPRSQRFRLR
jgi:hypothetical protein